MRNRWCHKFILVFDPALNMLPFPYKDVIYFSLIFIYFCYSHPGPKFCHWLCDSEKTVQHCSPLHINSDHTRLLLAQDLLVPQAVMCQPLFLSLPELEEGG